MVIPFLKTKYYIPAPSRHLVHRLRLLQQIEDGLHLGHRLTLISAPAGFGKTTLLADWVANYSQPVAWISLDENDNDPVRFWSYLISAIQKLHHDFGETILAMLQSDQSHLVNFEGIITNLINEMAAIIDDGTQGCSLLLVLDNYHFISSPQIRDGIAFILNHQPSQMHLAIATRLDPLLPIARLCVQGYITEIRAADLRFTEEEVASFLNGRMELDLSAEDIAAVEARTEGWAAAIQLMALWLQSQRDKHHAISSFTGNHHYLIDYQMDEVIAFQTEEVANFLCQTSILDHFCAPLCSAVTEGSHSQQIISYLEHANLFLVPLDDEHYWYRYHNLFAEFLRQHLRKTQPELIPQLHCRASDWYAQNKLFSEAIDHAIAGEGFECAADLIEKVAVKTIAGGEFSTVRSWVRALPEDLVRQRPYLCVYDASISNLIHELGNIEPRLQDAERAMEAQGLTDDSLVTRDLRAHIAAMRGYNVRREGNISLSIKLLEEVLAYLGDNNQNLQAVINLNLARAYMLDGNLQAAVDTSSRAKSLGKAADNSLTYLSATSLLVSFFIIQGRLREAAELCQQTISDYIERDARLSPMLSPVYIQLGRIFYEWNNLEEAAAHLTKGISMADNIGYFPAIGLGAILLACIKKVQLDRGIVVQLTEPIDRIVERVMASPDVGNSTGVRVRFWLLNGNLEAAQKWAEHYKAEGPKPEIYEVYKDLVLARVLMSEQKLEEALDLLERVCQTAEDCRGRTWMIKALILKAMIHEQRGEIDQALAMLKIAMPMAEPEGYVRSFIGDGEAMQRLLKQAVRHDVCPKYASTLLKAFTKTETVSMSPQDRLKPLPKESLNNREKSILYLMARGFSNHDIADKLFISVNTVKWYVSQMYGKLLVNNRAEAVDRAHALNIL